MLAKLAIGLILVCSLSQLACAEEAKLQLVASVRPDVIHPYKNLPSGPMTLIAGQGACGQFCNDIDEGNKSCDANERPVWDDNGNCACTWFSECE